jgi:hypothetical protein
MLRLYAAFAEIPGFLRYACPSQPVDRAQLYPGKAKYQLRRKASDYQFQVNGGPVSASAPQDAPLLWVIRDQFKLTGIEFSCGVGLCGA